MNKLHPASDIPRSVTLEQPEVIAWALRTREAIQNEHAKISSDPEFRRWAREQIEAGPWSEEDCIHKWVQRIEPEIPRPPIDLPDYFTEVSYQRGGFREFFVHLSSPTLRHGEIGVAIEGSVTVDWGDGVIEYARPTITVCGELEDVSPETAREVAYMLIRAATAFENGTEL